MKEIPGWFDFAALYDQAIASAQPGDILVELGVWKGKSLAHLARAAQLSGKQLSIHGVDHFRGDRDTGPASASLAQECRDNLAAHGVLASVQLHVTDTAAAAELFPPASVHFVFVDGAHDFASVSRDLRAWLPKIKPGGILAGHDIADPRVAAAVAALLPDAHLRPPCWVCQL